jgi:hypothetical protein
MRTSKDCVTHSINAYVRRASQDTNPSIAQLLLPNGKGDSHWYYKSDQVISTSAFDWPEEFPEYEGPVQELPEFMKKYFLPDRFAIHAFLTNYAKQKLRLNNQKG